MQVLLVLIRVYTKISKLKELFVKSEWPIILEEISAV